ncbi:MAG: TldD/PmbA family protein [candidate division Zixibacteria bacterium]|nr:TldD/PmbA family protein [candidate division Zixibacteria bacterium]
MALNRRDFLKKTGIISVSAVSAPMLLNLLNNMGCAPAVKREFSDSEIKAILENARSRGGDFSEIFIEDTASLRLKMSEQLFTSATAGVAGGVGVRTVDEDKNGYAYINGYDFSGALEASSTAAFIASTNHGSKTAEPIASDFPNTVKVEIPIESIPELKKMELMNEADNAARNFSQYVKQVDITYYDQICRRKIINSNGLLIENKLPLIWFVIEVLAEKNGVRHKGRCRLSVHQGFEFFEQNNIREAAIKAAAEAVVMLDAKPAPSGGMPVVMHPGWGGVLIHEAVGHGLEGDFIYKGASIYSDKLGRKVASPLVTMVDDSAWPNARGTTEFDDEGTIGQRNVLIEKGILKGYMHDLISAKMLHAKPTGNGRRESYRHYPIPRMTNTFLDNGNAKHDDIIADTKNGLYVKALSGGSVDTISGQFNFIVREAYLIEDGKVTTPAAGATLIGKGIDVLTNIDAVADNLELGVGICGKGQWVPVTAGVPTIRVAKGITVGGAA